MWQVDVLTMHVHHITYFYRPHSWGDNTFGSVCLSVYALENTQQKHHDIWNTVQDLCVFVSNQGAFAIKSLTQQSITFNVLCIISRSRLGCLTLGGDVVMTARSIYVECVAYITKWVSYITYDMLPQLL